MDAFAYVVTLLQTLTARYPPLDGTQHVLVAQDDKLVLGMGVLGSPAFFIEPADFDKDVTVLADEITTMLVDQGKFPILEHHT